MKNDDFRISVVIPTYNRKEPLQRAIRSVLAQTRPAEEIIVVDDGSQDDTRSMIESNFAMVRYFYQSNQGVSKARNAGIEQSAENWIALLDSDDEWKPDKLEKQVAALMKKPDLEFCHTDEIWIRNGKRVNAMHKHKKFGGYIFEKCLPLCVISPSSVLLKKTIFEKTGYFNEKLPACEDYDYWLRYCSANPVLYIDSPLLIKYGGHQDQLSQKYVAMDRFRLKVLANLLSQDMLSETQKKAVSETFVEKYKILESGAIKRGNEEVLRFCREILTELKNVSSISVENIAGVNRS